MSRPAAFIDKDGTLVRNVPFNVDPRRIELMPGAGEALRMLSDAGHALVVVTNQSGIAQGRFPASAMTAVHARLDELLAPSGVRLSGFYFCPHAENAQPRCACRKPEPGLIARAAAELDLDPARSWMIGDILDDIEAGRRAGCRAVLVHCGNEDQWQLTHQRVPHLIVSDLRAAAHFIRDAAEQRPYAASHA